MVQGKRVQISEKLFQELLDSCYGLLLYRYKAEDLTEFSGTTDTVLKQAHQVLRQAKERGFLPTGYEHAPELLLDQPLRLRKRPGYEPSIEVVRNLSNRTVNHLIRQHFNVEGYDCAQYWDCNHIECLTVSLKRYDRETRCRVARYKKDTFNEEEPSLEELLCELVCRGVLPEGNYEIWVE